MLAFEIRGVDVEGREIDAIDEILLRQLGETDWKGSAMPVKMDGPSATLVEPLTQGASESRTIALMEFGQPDENIGIAEKAAKRIEFLVARRGCVFCKDDSGNVSARGQNDILKGLQQRREYAGVHLYQNLLTR